MRFLHNALPTPSKKAQQRGEAENICQHCQAKPNMVHFMDSTCTASYEAPLASKRLTVMQHMPHGAPMLLESNDATNTLGRYHIETHNGENYAHFTNFHFKIESTSLNINESFNTIQRIAPSLTDREREIEQRDILHKEAATCNEGRGSKEGE